MAVEFDSLVVVASILLPVRERLAPALDRSPALRSRWRLFEEDLASAFDAAREDRDAASMASLLDDLKEALSSRRAAIETAAAVFIHGEAFGSLTGANRGELGFVVGAFGERPGQAPRVHSIDEPAPTICAQGRVPFVHGVDLEPDDVDILFRMLEPDELAAAMGFPAHYRWPGNKTQRTRQVGNAVAVGVARALVTALMADWLEAAA